MRKRPTLLIAALVLAGCGGGTASSHHSAEAVPAAAHVHAAAITVSSSTEGRPIPAGFVGLSIELNSLESYAGTSPEALNPVFLQLVRNLAPGQSPALRLGGDSTDWAWWPVPGMKRPRGIRITLTPNWLAVTRAVASALSARLILGIDLEANSIKLASTEARALVSGLPPSSLEAFELGNEPELYGQFTWGASGRLGRPRSYGPPQYDKDFKRYAAAVPPVPLAGPALGAPSWFLKLPQFVAGAPRLAVLTLHRYPLQECFIPGSSPIFPSIANMFAPSATTGEADTVAPYVGLAHRHRLTIRIDEMNTVSCGGASGVSNVFASALWATDALFEMARVGVDGVNVHTFAGATYELFTFKQAGGTWVGTVDPEYYGLMLFAQAAPPGSRLLRTTATRGSAIKAWATRATDGTIRVTLINKSRGPETITLKAGGATATEQLLRAPALTARSGITFAGQSFGVRTTTGMLAGTPRASSLTRTAGHYLLQLPAAGEALITIPPR